jgi:hypothetical protein
MNLSPIRSWLRCRDLRDPTPFEVTMMNRFKETPLVLLLALTMTATGCAPRPKKPITDPEVIDMLEKAEKDARSGEEVKASREIEAAEKEIIREDKAHPHQHPMKRISGEESEAIGERDAMNELRKADRDAKAKLPGEAGDEVKSAIRDLEKGASPNIPY